MFILYRIPFAPVRKLYQIGLLFTRKNGDFGAISVTERNCAAPITLSGESHIEQVLCHTLVQCEQVIRTVAEANK